MCCLFSFFLFLWVQRCVCVCVYCTGVYTVECSKVLKGQFTPQKLSISNVCLTLLCLLTFQRVSISASTRPPTRLDFFSSTPFVKFKPQISHTHVASMRIHRDVKLPASLCIKCRPMQFIFSDCPGKEVITSDWHSFGFETDSTLAEPVGLLDIIR